MRDRGSHVEIIEVLSPDDPLLDVDQRSLPGEPPASAAPSARRRWGAVAATVAASLAVGAWVITGDDDTPETATTTTTQPRAELTPAPFHGEHYLFDSDVVRSYSADIVTQPSAQAIYRLWGTTAADRPWWSVQAFPGTLDDFFFTDAVRTIVDGTEVIQRIGTRTLITLRDFGDGWVGSVTTSGLSGEVHVRLANDLRHEGSEIVESGATSEGLGLRRLAAQAWESQWLYGDVETQVRGIAADGTMVTLRVGTGDADVRQRALPYFTGGPAGYTTDGVNGHRRDTGEAVVIWAEGDRLLSLTAVMPLDQLEPLRDAVRPATDEEWTARLYGVTADYRLGKGWVLASGVDEQGREWSAGVQFAQRDGDDLWLRWWRNADGERHTVELPPATPATMLPRTIVVAGATYVFVEELGDERTMAVTTGDGTFNLMAVQSTDDATGTLFGVARVTTPGRVQMSVADG